MFRREKKLIFSIRKFKVGVASTVISMSFWGGLLSPVTVQAQDGGLVPGQPLEINYQYLLESELTEAEKAMIIKELPTYEAGAYADYYMVYRPVNQLPKSGSETSQVGIALGGALLVVGLALTKHKKKALVTSIFVVSGTGTMAVSALTGVALSGFNQVHTVTVGQEIPNTRVVIENHEFVGYILGSTPQLVAEAETTVTDPVTEVTISQAEVQKVVEVAQPVQDVITVPVEPVVEPITVRVEAIEYQIVYEVDYNIPYGEEYVAQEGAFGQRTIRLQGDLVLSDEITVTPQNHIIKVGAKTPALVAEELPVLDLSSDDVSEEGPVTEETPSQPEAPILPPNETVTPETPIIEEEVVTEKSTENLVVEEKPELEVVQGTEERVVETQYIPFVTRYENDTNLWEGETQVVTPGVSGVKEIVDTYQTVNGTVVGTPSRTERIVLVPSEQVEKRGIRPVLGQVEEVRKEAIRKDIEYKEDQNSPINTRTIELEGNDGLKEIHDVYETIKDQKTKLQSSITIDVVQPINKIVTVGTQPTTREEIEKYKIEYKPTDQLEIGQEKIEVPGQNGSILYTTTYVLNKANGEVTPNPEVNEVTKQVINQVILVGTKPKVVTRTINYIMEDGSEPPQPVIQKVEFSKEILSTDETTGLRTYSDWKSINNTFESVDSPIVSKYTAQVKTVPSETVTAESQNKTVDVHYRINIIEAEDRKVIKRTIHYLYEEDRNKAHEPEIQELTYTRTKFINEVTGKVEFGKWNLDTQNFEEKVSPEKDGYTVDIEKVPVLETTPESKDEEVTVLYTDKFIEVKDVDAASLYYSVATDSFTKLMALDSEPADLNNYYVKVNSDQFKDLQLSVKSITLDTKDGKPVYKVVATHPKLKQDENYNGYDQDYTIYVAKTESTTGVKTFKELLDKLKANSTETIMLANDISAEGYDLSVKDSAYITEVFTGNLTGKNGAKNYAIYDLKAPLFANIGKGATVTDLALKNVDIDANHYDKVGALAGRTVGAIIKNVVVQGDLAASNNYGMPDSNENGPGKITIGGLVAEVAGGTTIENSTFVGTINGDSTGIRYWLARGGASTELHVGGLAGSVVENSKLINNRVSADIHVNAVDGLAVANDPVWVRDPLGYPVHAGVLAGVINTGTHTNNYVEGRITNQLENQNTTYVDGKDRSQITGNVGDLYGIMSRAVANGNEALVEVINSTAPSIPPKEVEPQNIDIKNALALTNQYITNVFDVDYTKVKGYQEAYAKAYANMEKLLPFYNRAFIVKEANKLAANDKLVTSKLLSATPMKDSVVVSDVSGDKDAINKLLLHFENSEVEYRDVKYKEEFKDTKVAEYTLGNVTYTTDQFIGSYDDVVAAVKDELAALTYTSDEIWNALEPTTAVKNETKIQELYLEERFTEIQKDIEKVLKNVLGTSTAYSNTNSVVEYIKKNKAELLLGLSYVSKWYNIDFDKTNVQNLITYQPDFFGKQVSTLEWLVEVGSAGYRALDPKVNDEKAASLVGENNNSENLHEILESYRKVFSKDMKFEDWFKSSVGAYVATGKAIDNVSGKEIGNSDLYHQLNKRVAGVAWNRSAGTIDYSNMILPLLSAREDRIYIISTGSSMQFGALHTYVDPTLEKTDPEKYKQELEAVKQNIERVANNQAKHWEAWYAIAYDKVQDRLISNKPVWDTLFVKSGNTRYWSDRFGTNAAEAIKDFFGPLGKHGAGAPNVRQEAYSDGTNVGFTGSSALTLPGESIWTHEQVHNWDGGVYLGGEGRRAGANMEAFAEGLLQAPRSDSGERIRNAIGVNMYFDYKPEDNPFPEYNSSPERFQTAAQLQEYVKGMMDTLYVLDYAEAMAIGELAPSVQAQRLTKLVPEIIVDKNNAPTGHNKDKFEAVTEADLTGKDMKDINTYVENNFALARGYAAGRVGDITGTHYLTVSMLSPFYNLAQNDTGISGPFTFKRAAFEMLAEFGYDGFVNYASRKYATDKEAVDAIFNGSYENLTAFKKAMFAQRKDKLGSLQAVSFTANGIKYDIKDYNALQTEMNKVIAAGNTRHINEFKKQAFIAYKNLTQEFENTIFN